jgi:hypothetical protein
MSAFRRRFTGGFIDAFRVASRSWRAPSPRALRWCVGAWEVGSSQLPTSGVGALGVARRSSAGPSSMPGGSGSPPLELRRRSLEAPARVLWGCDSPPPKGRRRCLRGAAHHLWGCGPPPLRPPIPTLWGYPSPPLEHPLLGRNGSKSIILRKSTPEGGASARTKASAGSARVLALLKSGDAPLPRSGKSRRP